MTACPGQVEFRYLHGRGTSRGGNAPKRACIRRCKQNRAIATPCATASGWSIGEYFRRTDSDLETLQLAACEESDRSAIW